MTIQRDDLVAAAAAGVLHYSQVDPLLVFLLQRDVRAKRLALAAQARAPQRHWLHSLLLIIAGCLALLTAALFAVLYMHRITPAVSLAGVGAMLLYALAGVQAIAWIRRRGYARSLRVTLGVAMASLPLAVFALHEAI